MLDHETRPQHFLIPTLIIIVGGIFLRLETWEVVGWAIWAIGAANVYFLLYTARRKAELRLLQEEQAHYAEIMKLDSAKTKTKVAIEKTDLTGYMSQNFAELDIAPAKLKKFAYGALVEGKKLTIREWTPLKKGKLFSDGEWRRMMAFMRSPDWEDKHTKFVVPINPANDQDGFELTAAGRRWLEDVLEESVLVSSS